MMDHGRFAFSPINARPPIRWPNGAYVAVWVAPNIEHFRFNQAVPGGRGAVPDVPSYATRDYGNRVAIWRMMKVFNRYGIRASVMLNAEVCQYEPEIIEEGVRLGWEWLGHGLSNSRPLNGLSADEEEETITETLRIISEATGAQPRGWLGPGLMENARTPDLLKKSGLTYVADWTNDDQPYTMSTESGDLFSIPYTLELNDKRMYERLGVQGPDFVRMISDQFDTLYEEGADSGRVMCIALHPYLSGVPYRIRYLDEALAYINRHEHVWWATGSEIIEAYRAQLRS
jgi:peptidoglycan/xylan/chitin deacetylase (PgdA/CDA1 family)